MSACMLACMLYDAYITRAPAFQNEISMEHRNHLMHVCMYVCTYVCMYVCMYVYMYVCIDDAECTVHVRSPLFQTCNSDTTHELHRRDDSQGISLTECHELSLVSVELATVYFSLVVCGQETPRRMRFEAEVTRYLYLYIALCSICIYAMCMQQIIMCVQIMCLSDHVSIARPYTHTLKRQ
jgi:hypothetical protein